jgi:hypothetical protein
MCVCNFDQVSKLKFVLAPIESSCCSEEGIAMTSNEKKMKSAIIVLAYFIFILGCTARSAAHLSFLRVNAALSAAASSNAGGVISINFTGNTGPMASTEVAGVVAKTNWNNASGFIGSSPLALVDEGGNVTGATVVWSADNTHSLPIQNTPGNARMMSGYLDTRSGHSIAVTVSGLAANSNGYYIYIYTDGDN